MSARAARRRLSRGYTIVELVMSLAVLAIGASGVIAMQKVAISSNRSAKELALASRIAESWADQLALDGAIWSLTAAGASTLQSTQWIRLADPSQLVAWFVPNHSTLRDFGPGFGALGAPIDPNISPGLIRFCTHLQFAYMNPDTNGSGVIRAQIRVFWPAENTASGLPSAAATNLCSVNSATLNANIGAFHVIYLTTSIAQSPAGLL